MDQEDAEKRRWVDALAAYARKRFPGATVSTHGIGSVEDYESSAVVRIETLTGSYAIAITETALATLAKSRQPVDLEVFSRLPNQDDLFARRADGSLPMITGKIVSAI